MKEKEGRERRYTREVSEGINIVFGTAYNGSLGDLVLSERVRFCVHAGLPVYIEIATLYIEEI